MLPKAHLIPATGLIVRDPVTQEPLPAKGEPKPLNSYWLRRERDGDVTRKAEPSAASKPTPKATAKPVATESP